MVPEDCHPLWGAARICSPGKGLMHGSQLASILRRGIVRRNGSFRGYTRVMPEGAAPGMAIARFRYHRREGRMLANRTTLHCGY